jgi:ketosteroid isomerase-like protein
MSQENVEIVRRAFDAVSRGDLDGMAAELAPDFEYAATGAFVGNRTTSPGAEGFRGFLESFWEEFDDAQIEIHSLIDAGDQVLTWVTFSGRGTRSGAETGLDLWHVWELRSGQVVRGRAFTTKAEALEAAGLSE